MYLKASSRRRAHQKFRRRLSGLGEQFSRLLFTGQAIGGNTSIDNLTAVTLTAAVLEPETCALMLAGLGVLGFVARRRSAAR